MSDAPRRNWRRTVSTGLFVMFFWAVGVSLYEHLTGLKLTGRHLTAVPVQPGEPLMTLLVGLGVLALGLLLRTFD